MPSLLSRLVLTSTLALAALPAAALDLVYIVRHAQKNVSDRWSSQGALRPLSYKGAHCARVLSQTLRNRGINAVYSSELTRTLATGLAISGRLDDVDIIGDDATLEPTAEWVEELRRKHADDRAILIVGHSNTVDDLALAFRPDMVDCLEQFELERPAIPETQYGDIWRLSVRPGLEQCRGINRQVLPSYQNLDCTTP